MNIELIFLTIWLFVGLIIFGFGLWKASALPDAPFEIKDYYTYTETHRTIITSKRKLAIEDAISAAIVWPFLIVVLFFILCYNAFKFQFNFIFNKLISFRKRKKNNES